MALALNTGGVLAKLFAEAVEAIDRGPVEGVRATGAARLQEIVWGVIPQVAPLWTSYALYRFESNSRSATILGVIGAGGIGQVLFDRMNAFEYSEAVGRFRSWLNLMVNQQIGECFRSRVRDETIKRRYAEMLLELAEPGQGTSREPTGHDFELLAMAFQRVKASVRPQHWQLFEAFVVHGMSASEVARQIGVTSVMVRVTAFRVRNRLKEEWRGLQNGPF
jgi:RNA polymerase sigma factor (sigma-70 family)